MSRLALGGLQGVSLTPDGGYTPALLLCLSADRPSSGPPDPSAVEFLPPTGERSVNSTLLGSGAQVLWLKEVIRMTETNRRWTTKQETKEWRLEMERETR